MISIPRRSLKVVDKTGIDSHNPLFWSSMLSLLGNLIGVVAISSGYLPLPIIQKTLKSDSSSSGENSITSKTKHNQQYKVPVKEVDKQRLEMSAIKEKLQTLHEFLFVF